MKTTYDLSTLAWTLTGYSPWTWRLGNSMETGVTLKSEVGPLPAAVPGSVQQALLQAGIIPDWNQGLQARECEWVENRDWVFACELPHACWQEGTQAILHCSGLDGPGLLLVNGRKVGDFNNAFVPFRFDITPFLTAATNRLNFVFQPPPRWLGQIGYTSRMTALKPRFNYSWDWISRLVQIGLWDSVALELIDGAQIQQLAVSTDVNLITSTGRLHLQATVSQADTVQAVVALAKDNQTIHRTTRPATDLEQGWQLDWLPVELWWPNGAGAQPLYSLTVSLEDASGRIHDTERRTIGFRKVEWKPCQDAPAAADPWLLEVNGKPIFQFGVNWTPIRPNFADVPMTATQKRIDLYQQLGMNVLRVWGGAVLGTEAFYTACDRAGLMIWQEFPLSSSGLDNYPPEDSATIAAFAAIAQSYVTRRRHHPALILWTGGNELTHFEAAGEGLVPLTCTHPMLAAFAQIVARYDPDRRFVPTSPSGPNFGAEAARYGQGVHWDVHGPWTIVDENLEAHRRYYAQDDALFRSEAGTNGASSAAIIRQYSGGLPVTPGTADNPLWRRTNWWITWPVFVKQVGREPTSLEEFVDWSQARQAEALCIAGQACRARFPKCGGLIIWMGHDSFPCTENTSIIDFHGNLKPAAQRLQELFASRTGT